MDGSRLSYAALLTLILLLAAIALTYTMVVSGLNVAGCGDRCDYPSITRAMNGFLVAAGLSLTIAVAGSYLLREGVVGSHRTRCRGSCSGPGILGHLHNRAHRDAAVGPIAFRARIPSETTSVALIDRHTA